MVYSLIESPFSSRIFTDHALHQKTSYGMLYVALPTYLVLTFVMDAPFGKLLKLNNNKKNGKSSPSIFDLQFDARMSWMIMESPNLIWCFLGVLNAIVDVNNNTSPLKFGNANFILLGMFFLHYMNRTIIYPMRMSKNSKPVPLLISSVSVL